MARAARRGQPRPPPPVEPPGTPAAALAAPGGAGPGADAGAAPGSAERVNPWSALSPSIAAWRSAGRTRGLAAASLLGQAGPSGAAAPAVLQLGPAAADGADGDAADGMAPPRARRAPRKQQQLAAAAASAARPSPPPPQAVAAGAGAGVQPQLWAAFREAAEGRAGGGAAAVMEVSNLLVVPPEVSYRSKAQKDVRKQVGAPSLSAAATCPASRTSRVRAPCRGEPGGRFVVGRGRLWAMGSAN